MAGKEEVGGNSLATIFIIILFLFLVLYFLTKKNSNECDCEAIKEASKKELARASTNDERIEILSKYGRIFEACNCYHK
jgi:hypothetical protein